MITPNLGLESIELADNMQTSLLQKMNSNFIKIDEAYKELVDSLIEVTGKENLKEAISEFDNVKKYKLPVININFVGVSLDFIGGYGAGMNHNGELIIWVMSNTDSYENIRFNPLNIGIGTQGVGWLIDTGAGDYQGPINQPQACTLTNIDTTLNTINIELEISGLNSSRDYLMVDVTVTTE